jgi:hypothetical protein
VSSSKTIPAETNLSIEELPGVVTDLFARAGQPLLPQAQGPVGLFVRYLRRKPERGLAVIYMVDEVRSQHNARANNPLQSVSLTLDEKALEGARIRFNASDVQQADIALRPGVDGRQQGVLHLADLGLSVQAFPVDPGLPALAQSCDAASLIEPLMDAVQILTEDPTWKIAAASAYPVRYKPANRCVIRYDLLLQHASGEKKELTVFGKVYANPAQASSVQALQQQLYTEQEQRGIPPMLPRPLGIIESIGLTFNEAITAPPAPENAADPWSTLRTGNKALRPGLERGRGGEITRLILPEEELHLSAQALARLHTSTVRPNESAPRTGAKEAKRAQQRAALISERNPEQAGEVQRLAGELAARLAALQPDGYYPAHGGFKASQLLFHSHRVFVVDFDGFCLADPALDVGYFLAYLRPSALWYRRPGMREWFEEAAVIFRNAYKQAMTSYGIAQSTINDILIRSRLYEAALLFKIATRRVNRLNSPRPKELSAMLEEIAACLASELR